MSNENKVVFQPYKIGVKDWQVVENSLRMDGDRPIYTVFVGQRLEKGQDDVVLRQNPVSEDIYLDVLQGIFTQSNYKVRVRLGRKPNLIITYNGTLIAHNDHTNDYVQLICSNIQSLDHKSAVEMLTNGVLNENAQEKLTAESQHFAAQLKDVCGVDFSPEFITEALKKYFCEDLRQFDLPGAQDLHYVDYAGLVNTAGEVLKGRLNGSFDENLEEVLLEELLYRVISGNLVEKG